jgi:hypothetical protein
MFGADLSDSVDTISSEGRPPSIRKAASERAIHSAEASERLYLPSRGPLPHLGSTAKQYFEPRAQLEDTFLLTHYKHAPRSIPAVASNIAIFFRA